MSNAGFVFGQRFAAGASVCARMYGELLQGDYCGVSQEGHEFLRVRVPNKIFPVGFIVSLPIGKMHSHCVPKAAVVERTVQLLDVTAPAFVPAVPVVERQAPAVELSDGNFPRLQTPVRKFVPQPSRVAPQVAKVEPQAPSGVKRQVTKVEPRAPSGGKRSVPNAAALEKAAIDCVVTKTVLQAGEVGLRQRIVHTTHAQFEVRVPCPAYEIVDVDGKLSRASIPFTLGKRISEIREELIQKLEYVPPGTYIRLSWDFKREDGKLSNETGLVKVFFKW